MTIHDDILHELGEIEHHLHNYERWWGATPAPNTANAILMGVDNPHVVISGNNTWGAAVPVVGRLDNPVRTIDNIFDIHRITIADPDNATMWLLRFLWGTESLEEAAQAQRWSAIEMIASGVGSNISTPGINMVTDRMPVGSTVWAQGWNVTNLAELSFFHGCHGYVT